MLTAKSNSSKVKRQIIIGSLLFLSFIFVGCFGEGYGDWGYSGGFSSDYSYRPPTNNKTNNTVQRSQKDKSSYGPSTQPYIKNNIEEIEKNDKGWIK